MKTGYRKFANLPTLLLILTALISCTNADRYSHFVVGEERDRNQLEFLFETLEEQDSPESRYIINLEIYRILSSLKQNGVLNAFLLEQTNRFPEDPFNSYYLSIVANDFRNRKMPAMAEGYYKRIIRNHPGVEANGQPIRLLALMQLTRICTSPEDKILYSNMLLDNYSDQIDTAPIHYLLAKSREELGYWEAGIGSWKAFIRSPYAGMQGEENLRKEAKSLIKYYEYQNKNWTYTSLDGLVNAVKRAIRRQDAAGIRRSMAKVNFFAVSWAQEPSEARMDFLDSIGTFMRRRISFKSSLDKNSNDQEAYLETNNWSYRIPTWYLYFRRIDFPADPEIHGKWEWAGIYFGEKPFKSSD